MHMLHLVGLLSAHKPAVLTSSIIAVLIVRVIIQIRTCMPTRVFIVVGLSHRCYICLLFV